MENLLLLITIAILGISCIVLFVVMVVVFFLKIGSISKWVFAGGKKRTPEDVAAEFAALNSLFKEIDGKRLITPESMQALLALREELQKTWYEQGSYELHCLIESEMAGIIKTCLKINWVVMGLNLKKIEKETIEYMHEWLSEAKILAEKNMCSYDFSALEQRLAQL